MAHLGRRPWPRGQIAAAVVVTLLFVPTVPSEAAGAGEGKTVRPARATWDTGWFETVIYIKALEELGYEIEEPKTLDSPLFYQAVAQGDVDFWVNGWFPGHDVYEETFEEGASLVGYVLKDGGFNGYLIDKKTADEHGITNLGDLKNPEVAKLFDGDGDGKAELVACPPGWTCGLIIEHHVDVYGLRDTVETIEAEYSVAMADAIERYRAGQPILYYSWIPNWTMDALKPGEDVVWIEVPFPSLPGELEQFEGETTIAGVEGCVDDPCELGWNVSDIRPVVNNKFLEENPAAKRLFEVVEIPVGDISAQNLRMFEGEDSEEDIRRHAEEWIAAHRETFDRWIADAARTARPRRGRERSHLAKGCSAAHKTSANPARRSTVPGHGGLPRARAGPGGARRCPSRAPRRSPPSPLSSSRPRPSTR